MYMYILALDTHTHTHPEFRILDAIIIDFLPHNSLLFCRCCSSSRLPLHVSSNNNASGLLNPRYYVINEESIFIVYN